ncbi:MAG: aldo/keto reductase [Deltaproteobacteria bacterium]|nr:aldo/keto reductase [Deltaproteobacteria bacterium]
MDYRFLGHTGLRVSELVMGTMAFGGDADEKTSAELYGLCREAGINTFDCADAYSGGRAEEILGSLIRDERDQVVIASKGYFPRAGAGPNDRGSSRYHLVSAVEASLRRLHTDRIDIYFLHRFDDETRLEDTLRALEDLVHAGKILYPAASNFAAWHVAKALGIQARQGYEPFCCIQPMYNLVKRQAEVEILPQALAEGIGVLPYSPLGAGLLTGKYGADKRPSAGRILDSPLYATRYGEDLNFAIADGFASLAAARGISPVALAIAWVAAHPAVTAPLIGARNREQLLGCLAATEVTLDDELYAAIAALSPTPPLATDRNEEGSANNFGAR